jgi:hypothetical protein
MATKKAPAKKSAQPSTAPERPEARDAMPAPSPATGAAAEAARLVEGADGESVAREVDALLGDARTAATQAARVLGEVAVQKPAVLAYHVDRFVAGLESDNPRVVQTCAEVLPALATVAPARVAKHLDKLKAGFASLPDAGKDGVVRTFANLCSASVAYQKRLEPVLKAALAGCDGKTLVAWTLIVLPALKGEPHANARAVVEKRLPELGKPHAQAIADFLGIKLRVRR